MMTTVKAVSVGGDIHVTGEDMPAGHALVVDWWSPADKSARVVEYSASRRFVRGHLVDVIEHPTKPRPSKEERSAAREAVRAAVAQKYADAGVMRADADAWVKSQIDAMMTAGEVSALLKGAIAREQMVSTIIARQVEQGGVDTEGTRAQAERWCAMLCECVCEGMRATTAESRHRLARRDGCGSAGINPMAGKNWRVFQCQAFRGKPLGRP